MTSVHVLGRSRLGVGLDRLNESLGALEPPVTMTLLLLILYSSEYWYVRVPVTAIAISAILFEPLKRSPRIWFVIAVIVTLGNYHNQFDIDNHKYLLGYWCLAVFCALHAERPLALLARDGRWMIGLSFLFAVFWKATTEDYLGGAFFQFSLLLDERFRSLAAAFGGVTEPMRDFNLAAQQALVSYDSRLTAVALRYPLPVTSLAKAMTWWAFLMEVLIALAFLAPVKTRLSRYRDLFLLAFIVCTYAIAPVIGFGWILAIMGMVQADARLPFVRLLYTGAFILLVLYRIPWGQFMGTLLTVS